MSFKYACKCSYFRPLTVVMKCQEQWDILMMLFLNKIEVVSKFLTLMIYMFLLGWFIFCYILIIGSIVDRNRYRKRHIRTPMLVKYLRDVWYFLYLTNPEWSIIVNTKYHCSSSNRFRSPIILTPISFEYLCNNISYASPRMGRISTICFLNALSTFVLGFVLQN